MELGEYIAKYRKEAGVTLDDLAARSGVPKGTINKIIAGTTKSPTLETVCSIANALGKTINDFMDPPQGSKKTAPLYSSEAAKIAKDYDSLDHWGKAAVRSVADTELARMQDEARFLAEPSMEPEPKVVNLFTDPSAAGPALGITGQSCEPYTLTPNDPQGAAYAVRVQGDSMEPDFPDGSIAFAENPPKKYQDIYPIDFNADMPGIEKEVERIMNLWIEAGVTIFRIDNPHTKPVRFWQDVIAAVTKKHPEVLFLAEAFTRPGMMRALSYVGFTQSHCYFPWRNTKDELEEYLPVTNGDDGYYQHNTFWPTTPDILTAYVRDNGVAGHCVRAVLAAMGSPSWGIYNGYELIENKQRPGFEEQIDNEKYEVKVRDWSAADKYGIAELLTSLNRIRREHVEAFSYHNVSILPSSDPNIIAFARHTPAELTSTGKPETLIVVVNLDGHNAHQSLIHLELPDLDIDPKHDVQVRDELTGHEFTWGWDNFVSLAPWADVAHVFHIVR